MFLINYWAISPDRDVLTTIDILYEKSNMISTRTILQLIFWTTTFNFISGEWIFFTNQIQRYATRVISSGRSQTIFKMIQEVEEVCWPIFALISHRIWRMEDSDPILSKRSILVLTDTECSSKIFCDVYLILKFMEMQLRYATNNVACFAYCL